MTGLLAVQNNVAFPVHPKTRGCTEPLASSPSSKIPGTVTFRPRHGVHPCFPCSLERVLQRRRLWEEDGMEEDSEC